MTVEPRGRPSMREHARRVALVLIVFLLASLFAVVLIAFL
jgi:hypothetical protein